MVQRDEQKYKNQLEWDKEIDRLLEKIQNFGEILPPIYSKELAENLIDIISDFVEGRPFPHYDIKKIIEPKIRENKKEIMESKIREELKHLQENQLVSTQSLVERLNFRYNAGKIHAVLKRIHCQEGLAYIYLAEGYWLRPTPSNKQYPNYLLLPSILALDGEAKAIYQFISHSINKQGFCESPTFLSKMVPSKIQLITGHYYHSNKPQFEKYLKLLLNWKSDDQPIFNSFVNKSSLPTATLEGRIAIVYHPQVIRKLQGLSNGGSIAEQTH